MQTGTIVLDAVLLGLGCGGLVNNLLVVNNYRDREGDARAGKNTLVVRFGRRFAIAQCCSASLVAALVLIVLFTRCWLLDFSRFIPAASGLRLTGRLQRAQSGRDYLTCLQIAGRIVVSFGILVSLGYILA